MHLKLYGKEMQDFAKIKSELCNKIKPDLCNWILYNFPTEKPSKYAQYNCIYNLITNIHNWLSFNVLNYCFDAII